VARNGLQNAVSDSESIRLQDVLDRIDKTKSSLELCLKESASWAAQIQCRVEGLKRQAEAMTRNIESMGQTRNRLVFNDHVHL
jgi:hypothetical protein